MYYGIDLGGTKIEGLVLQEDRKEELGYRILYRKRVATEQEGGYGHVIGQLRGMLNSMEKESGEKALRLGVSAPGSIDPESGKLKNSNSTILNGRPFLADTRAALGCHVAMANDANCFALGELRMGVAREYAKKTVFGVIMGTGVGGGIIVNGHVLNGSMGLSGEWGHNFLDSSGGACYCGKIGCVEQVISGPALERFYDEQRGTGLEEIHKRHRKQSDAKASKTIERLCHFFGLAMSVMVNILDPDIIVLGGGVGNIDELLREGLSQLKKHTFNTNLHEGKAEFTTVLAKPKLGDSAGVFGAAFL